MDNTKKFLEAPATNSGRRKRPRPEGEWAVSSCSSSCSSSASSSGSSSPPPSPPFVERNVKRRTAVSYGLSQDLRRLQQHAETDWDVFTRENALTKPELPFGTVVAILMKQEDGSWMPQTTMHPPLSIEDISQIEEIRDGNHLLNNNNNNSCSSEERRRFHLWGALWDVQGCYDAGMAAAATTTAGNDDDDAGDEKIRLVHSSEALLLDTGVDTGVVQTAESMKSEVRESMECLRRRYERRRGVDAVVGESVVSSVWARNSTGEGVMSIHFADPGTSPLIVIFGNMAKDLAEKDIEDFRKFAGTFACLVSSLQRDASFSEESNFATPFVTTR